MSEENKEETPVTQTIEQVEEKEPDHMEQTVGEHLDEAYEKSTAVDAEKLNKSLKRVMRTLPLEHLSGAMSSYIAFMNLFVKRIWQSWELILVEPMSNSKMIYINQ